MLLVWIAVILSSNPVGELTSELVYLTASDLRLPGVLALGVLGLEAVELTYPLIVRAGAIGPEVDITTSLNLIQGVVLVLAGVLVLRVVLRYTHGGLERRIRSSIDTLAFLQGQRRRRRRG